MDQERTYSILFLLLFFFLLLLCPLSSLRCKDDCTSTGKPGFHFPPFSAKPSFHFPPFSVKSVTFIGDFSPMNESFQLSSGAAVVFSIPFPFQETKANSSVSFRTEFSFSVQGSQALDEPVLAVEFEPLIDFLKFKNGSYHGRNRCPTLWLFDPVKRIKKPFLSAKFNLENQFSPFPYVGFSKSVEDRNITNLVIKRWSFEEFMPETSQFENHEKKDIVLGAYTPVFAFISIFSALWSYFKKLFKGKEDPPQNTNQDSSISNLLSGFRKFTYSELSSATKLFHQTELIGDGVVASIYRASFPGSLTIYAVKRFHHDFTSKKCYETEVRTLHHLRHQNILELRGWCDENPNEPLLLYDYMPNKSLHDVFLSGKILIWPHRYNIAVGIAKALLYLHHECKPSVIHADIKEDNVLLDSELNPKLADFGMALIGSSYRSRHRPSGAFPSRSQIQGWVSPKIDVFMYGSLVLELCCRRTEEYIDFIKNLRNLKMEGRLLEAVDEKLGGNFNEEEMLRLLNLGIECVDEDLERRPPMVEVLQILLSEREEEEGDSPGYIIEINERV